MECEFCEMESDNGTDFVRTADGLLLCHGCNEANPTPIRPGEE